MRLSRELSWFATYVSLETRCISFKPFPVDVSQLTMQTCDGAKLRTPPLPSIIATFPTLLPLPNPSPTLWFPFPLPAFTLAPLIPSTLEGTPAGKAV